MKRHQKVQKPERRSNQEGKALAKKIKRENQAHIKAILESTQEEDNQVYQKYLAVIESYKRKFVSLNWIFSP